MKPNIRLYYGALTLLVVMIVSAAAGITIEPLRWLLALSAASAIALIGGILTVPRAYSATRAIRVKIPPSDVFDILTSSTDWRSDVSKIELLPSENGHARWRETWLPFRVVTVERIECERPRRLVTQAAGSGATFKATWTYDLAPLETGGAQVRLTDRGEYDGLWDRIYQHTFAGPQAPIERHLSALLQRLGESAPIEH